jgi:hypothetical protein
LGNDTGFTVLVDRFFWWDFFSYKRNLNGFGLRLREVVQQKSDCESTISTSTVAQVKASDSQKKHGENNKKDSWAQWE